MILAGLVSHSIHTDLIEPTAVAAALGAVAVQAAALAVSFGVIGQGTASTIVAITVAATLALCQLAHAVLARQVADLAFRHHLLQGKIPGKP